MHIDKNHLLLIDSLILFSFKQFIIYRHYPFQFSRFFTHIDIVDMSPPNLGSSAISSRCGYSKQSYQ